MIGSNQIKLNHAQMNEAVEYYLKNVMFKDSNFDVVSVAENKSTSWFEINLEENNAEKENRS